MKFLTKKNVKAATFEYIPMALGIRVPGFIRIHFRYALRNPFIYLVLVIAPFILGLMLLSAFSTYVLKTDAKGWQIFFITLFFIALAFYAAERSRQFRKLYVIAIPGMVIANGVFNLFFKSGLSFGSYIVFLILAVIPALILGKLSMGYGYRLLSDGADKNYRRGRDLYMAGEYGAAFLHLEPSARRGHMKSLYLLGHAHEFGHDRELDIFKATRFYEQSSSRGYRKATEAYERLIESFDTEQMTQYKADLGSLNVNQLF
jgi:hypothetical protein